MDANHKRDSFKIAAKISVATATTSTTTERASATTEMTATNR